MVVYGPGAQWMRHARTATGVAPSGRWTEAHSVVLVASKVMDTELMQYRRSVGVS